VLRAVPMVRLQVQVTSRDGPAVTRCIASQGLLHLIDIGHGATTARPGSAARDLLADARTLARNIRQLAGALDIPPRDLKGDLPPDEIGDFGGELGDLRRLFEPLRAAADAELRRVAAAREEMQRLRDELDRASRIAAARVEIARIAALRFACVRLGSASADDLARLADRLAPSAFAIVTLEGGPAMRTVAVAVPASCRDQLDAALRSLTFVPLDGGLPIRDAPAVRADIDRAADAEVKARGALDALRDRIRDDLTALARRADLAVVLLQAQTLCTGAGHFVVISGWIPEDQAPQLAAALARATHGRALVSTEKPEDARAMSAAALAAPILHRNPLLRRSLQSLVGPRGTPSDTERQPAAYFAVSFLLMFGLMFGDVGHGAALVAAGYCLFRYMPRFLDYGILMMEAGVASAAFGVLYGSVFGVEDWLPALWLHPIRDLAPFTRVAATLGFVMVSVGLVLGIVDRWRGGDRASAVVGLRGLFGAFACWTSIAIVARGLLPVDWIVPDGAIALLLAAAVALLILRPAIVRALAPHGGAARAREGATPWWLRALENVIELIDTIVSTVTNASALVRVTAFTTVHAAILLAVFALVDTLEGYRVTGWLSLLVLVGGNALTILFEGLTVTVQPLRLEYYEFFRKFFTRGGR
jgi:V/A-type H+/Na+-transporting ATPase subunit I